MESIYTVPCALYAAGVVGYRRVDMLLVLGYSREGGWLATTTLEWWWQQHVEDSRVRRLGSWVAGCLPEAN